MLCLNNYVLIIGSWFILFVFFPIFTWHHVTTCDPRSRSQNVWQFCTDHDLILCNREVLEAFTCDKGSFIGQISWPLQRRKIKFEDIFASDKFHLREIWHFKALYLVIYGISLLFRLIYWFMIYLTVFNLVIYDTWQLLTVIYLTAFDWGPSCSWHLSGDLLTVIW
jgi:hypothetical protein